MTVNFWCGFVAFNKEVKNELFRTIFQLFPARPHHRDVARHGSERNTEEDKMKSEWRVTCNYICGGLVYNVYRLRDLDEIDHSGNREYVDDRIMRAIERMMQRKLDTATPIDMVAAADLLNVVNEVLKNE